MNLEIDCEKTWIKSRNLNVEKIKKTDYQALSLLVFFLFMLPISLYAREIEDVKATYLGTLSNYTTWTPTANLSDEKLFKICVLGSNPFKEFLKLYTKKPIKNKSVQVDFIKEVNEISHCHSLFISNSERKKIEQILEFTKNKPILTISDIRGFAEKNGMIQLYMRTQKIHMKINNEVALRYGLKISSDILSLKIVKIVTGTEQ